MKFCKKIWLRYRIKKYERVLLEEGVREAANRGKNIRFGLEGKAVINENPFERIYLPQNEDGRINISPILALGAEKYPGEAKKYLVYQKILKRLEE